LAARAFRKHTKKLVRELKGVRNPEDTERVHQSRVAVRRLPRLQDAARRRRLMKAALIADVHGNLPALDAVLDDARQQGTRALWNLGDAVGYGPFPNQVLDRLRAEGAVSILGNYDRKVLAFPEKRGKWRRSKAPEKFEASRWTWETSLADEPSASGASAGHAPPSGRAGPSAAGSREPGLGLRELSILML